LQITVLIIYYFDYVDYVVLRGFGSVNKEVAGESVEATKLNDDDNDEYPKAVVMWVTTRVRAKVCVNVGNEEGNGVRVERDHINCLLCVNRLHEKPCLNNQLNSCTNPVFEKCWPG
jgi:hypothetical protein